MYRSTKHCNHMGFTWKICSLHASSQINFRSPINSVILLKITLTRWYRLSRVPIRQIVGWRPSWNRPKRNWDETGRFSPNISSFSMHGIYFPLKVSLLPLYRVRIYTFNPTSQGYFTESKNWKDLYLDKKKKKKRKAVTLAKLGQKLSVKLHGWSLLIIILLKKMRIMTFRLMESLYHRDFAKKLRINPIY